MNNNRKKCGINFLLGIGVCMGVCVLAYVALAVYAFVSVSFFDKTRYSYPQQLARAESAIADAGGAAVLASEARKVLESVRANKENKDFLLFRELPSISPTLHHIEKKFPNGRLWVAKPHRVAASVTSEQNAKTVSHWIEIPERLVIRYGTHSTYVWMVIFSPDNTLAELPEGVVHLGETVYLSKRKL